MQICMYVCELSMKVVVSNSQPYSATPTEYCQNA